MNNVTVFDGHNDVLMRLYRNGDHDGQGFFEDGVDGHLDLPRARRGGLGGGFCAVFIPGDPDDPNTPSHDSDYSVLPPALSIDYAQRTAFTMTATLMRIEASSGGQVKIVRSVNELTTSLRDGVFAAILHFEGAEAIDRELNALEVFYQAGLRSLGPVWSRPNVFGHGVPFAFSSSPNTGPGLTDAGRSLVRECNRLGIMIDLSHITERGFHDVAALTDAPLVATHSNVHALCPSPRNLTDYQLDAIRESGGMVGLNFANCFLRTDGTSKPDVPIDVMVTHLTYLVERLGIEHVGFGSDFDGADIPEDIGDVTGLPILIEYLRTTGYDDDALSKLTHENWIRVLEKTWR